MEDYELKAALEALVFVAGEPVRIGTLAKTVEVGETDVKNAMNELIAEYRDRSSGIVIAEVEDSYKMVSNPDTGTWVRKFRNINQASKLSQPSLEILAIIAYKQPITKLEIDQLRGVNSDGPVRSLVEKKLIRIIGKKDTPGRPFLYGTTRDFLEYFGLKTLSELPSINEFLRDEAS